MQRRAFRLHLCKVCAIFASEKPSKA